MPNVLGVLAIALLVAMVLTRVALLRRGGITAIKFGETDKSDFLIPPFALFYIYLLCAGAFGWPTVVHQELFSTAWLQWLGVAACAAALLLMLWSLASFGASFRIGIDTQQPGGLVTTGVFAFTRNPIYVAFAFVLLGEFLIAPNWLFLIYLVAGVALFHRQVLREEAYLRGHDGEEFEEYCRRVRRYI